MVGKILDKRYVVLEEVGADGQGFRYLVYDMNSLKRVHLRVDPDGDGELTGKTFELVDQSAPLAPADQAAPAAAAPAPQAEPPAGITPQQTSPDGAAPPQPKVRLVTPPEQERTRKTTPVGFGSSPVHRLEANQSKTTKIPRAGIDESAPSLASLVNDKEEAPKLSLVAQAAAKQAGGLEQALERALDPNNQEEPDPANQTQPIDLASAEEILEDEAQGGTPPAERPRLQTRQLEAAWFAQGEQLEEDPVEMTASIPKFDQEDLERAAADLSPDEYRKYALDLPPPVLPPVRIVEAFLEAKPDLTSEPQTPPPRIATPAATPAAPPATASPAPEPLTPTAPTSGVPVPAPVPTPTPAPVVGPAPVPAPVPVPLPAAAPAPVPVPSTPPVVAVPPPAVAAEPSAPAVTDPVPTPAPAAPAPVLPTPAIGTPAAPAAPETPSTAMEPVAPPPTEAVPPPVLPPSAAPDPVAPAQPLPPLETQPAPLSEPRRGPATLTSFPHGGGAAYAGTALRPHSDPMHTKVLGSPYAMLVIGLFMGGLVSGAVTCLATPSQEDIQAAVATAVKAAAAAQPAPTANLTEAPRPAPKPAPEPAAQPEPEAQPEPVAQPEPAVKPPPKPQPKPRRLSRRQRKRLQNYLYLARKAYKRRRYGSVRHWSRKALKIQPASKQAQLLKDRADDKLGR